MDWPNSSASGANDQTFYIGNVEVITRNGGSNREVRRRVGPVTLSRTVDTAGVVIGSDARYLSADAQRLAAGQTSRTRAPGM
ncbi:MAG: hypothetical protein WB784_12295 [Rhodanobacteraceae bacterium]